MSDPFGDPFATKEKDIFGDPFGTDGRTSSALSPYIAKELQVQEKKNRTIQPLRWLFDRLQTGQYVSANIADEIISATRDGRDPVLSGDLAKAVWEGVTGKRKGSYSDIFEKYTPWGATKIFPNREESKIGGNATWGDVAGFLGDVLLDPLTYIGIGPTKAAQATAAQFADDTIRTTRALLGRHWDELADFAQGVATKAKPFDRALFDRLKASNPDEAIQYITSFGDTVSRYFNKVYKEAYQEALRRPASELREKMGSQLDEILQWQEEIKGNRLYEEANKFLKKNPMLADNLDLEDLGVWLDDFVQTGMAEEAPNTIEEFATKLQGLVGDRYGGGGERSWKLFGQDVAPNVRQPNFITRSWDVVENAMRQSKPGQFLERAWWSVMNNGVVGKIRKSLGFRNPYERLVRFKDLREGEEKFISELNRNIRKVVKATDGFDDDIMQKYVYLNDVAEELWTPANPVTIGDLIDNDELVEQAFRQSVYPEPKIAPEDKSKILDLWARVRELTNSWQVEYAGWEAEGVVDSIKDMVNYLPTWFKDPNMPFRGVTKEIGAAKPKYAMARQYTRLQTAKQEAAKIKMIFGISSEDAMDLVRRHNLTGFSMDLRELLMMRALGQAKTAKRANMIMAFREFGIPVGDVQGVLKSAMTRPGAVVPQLGLKEINERGLEGLLFDDVVADVLERAVQATDPKNVGWLMGVINSFTGWWKGMVTMTSGFHARNFFSNNMTGFMKHGPRWFDPRDQASALAGVVYVLRQNDPATFMKEIGMDESMFRQLLAKRYGGRTVGELAEEAMRAGVISEATHGFDVKTLLDKVGGQKNRNWNPLSTKFVGRDLSFKVGSYVESMPKFQTFLIDYTDTVGKVGHEAALDYATREAKKWFIDYNDLTDFEKKFMKSVIPFYTWLRHNIANQLSAIVMYPQNFSIFPKLQQAFTYDDPDFDPDMIPDWMKQLGMFPAGRLDTGEFAMFNPNFPYQDLNKIPLLFEEGGWAPIISGREVKDDIVNAMHPMIKTVMQAMTEKGYDFFYKQELEDTRRAPFLMRLFLSNPRILGALDGIARMAGRDDGIKAYVDKEGKLQIDGKTAKILEDNLPLLRQIDYLIYGAEALTSRPGIQEGALEKALEAFSGAEDDYEGWEQFFQVLSYFAGVKFKPLDVEKEKEAIASDIYWRAQDRKKKTEERLNARRPQNPNASDAYYRQVRRMTGI